VTVGNNSGFFRVVKKEGNRLMVGLVAQSNGKKQNLKTLRPVYEEWCTKVTADSLHAQRKKDIKQANQKCFYLLHLLQHDFDFAKSGEED
jgi:hypothetical protein